MRAILEPEFQGDSADYDVLVAGVELSANVRGLSCEIGLRLGGGTKLILDAIKEHELDRVHIAIDPYGDIEYIESNTEVLRHDYTNAMRDMCLTNMYLFCAQSKSKFIFINLEDTEFFARYADGVPTYSTVKTIETDYALVHFDGPHSAEAIRKEIDFFHTRTPRGAVFVFDDVKLYDHETLLHPYLTELGWVLFAQGERKWGYTKE